MPVPAVGQNDPTSLVAAAAGGDPAAQAELVRATRPEVWRLAAAMVGAEAADDVTQETYLRALSGLRGYAGRAGFRTWLLSIARRACADHIRAATRRRRLAGRLQLAPVAAVPDHAGLLDATDLLSRLDPQRRAAFVLTQVVGLSYAEAAEVEAVPVGTIRSRVARARTDLIVAMGTSATQRASNSA